MSAKDKYTQQLEEAIGKLESSLEETVMKLEDHEDIKGRYYDLLLDMDRKNKHTKEFGYEPNSEDINALLEQHFMYVNIKECNEGGVYFKRNHKWKLEVLESLVKERVYEKFQAKYDSEK